jgi:hypothetical protein
MSKRTRNGGRQEVTVLAVDFFRRALVLRPIRQRCLDDRGCRAPGPGERCRECLEYFRLGRALANELGIGWLCDTSPLDVTTKRPPEYLRHREIALEDWWAARKLRDTLEAADSRPSSSWSSIREQR